MMKDLTFLRRVLAIFIGGFFGTLLRYGLSLLIQLWAGKGWPLDILLINLTGACLLAFVTTLADATFLISPTRRLFINVGFLGAYTTFSSLALGDILLLAAGHWLGALLYLVLSLFGGILAILVGEWLGKLAANRYRGVSGPRISRVSGELSAPAEELDIQDDLLLPTVDRERG